MSFNAKDMTRGGQIASMRIRMFSQIANIIVYCLVILFGIIVAITLSVKLTADVRERHGLLLVSDAGPHARYF